MPAIEMFAKAFVGATYTQDSLQVVDTIGFNSATIQFWVEPALASGDTLTVQIEQANLNDEGAFIVGAPVETLTFTSATDTTQLATFGAFGRFLRASIQVNLTSGASGYNVRGIVSLKLFSALPAATPYTGPYDWADPAFEIPGDQLSAIDPTAWSDAGGAFGGSKTSCVQTVESRLLRVSNAFQSNCSTPQTGDRANGILIAVPSGDFIRAMRIGFRRSVAATVSSSVLTGGAVFVDGTSASAAWYGVHAYWGGTDLSYDVYKLSHSAAAGAWETYSAYTLLKSAYSEMLWDCVLERSGTTLTAYVAAARGQLAPWATWTVSTGAGMVGIRTATLLSTADTLAATLYAYRESLTEVP